MAAGLGFKTFATGDVLSAADVNGYLMQGVLVFASAAARDSAITSPQEGQFAYLKDTNVTTYYTGSAWTNLDTTGMVNPMTTTGDTIYSSSGSTPARLGIGTAGQVLKVNSGATAPEWATASAGALTLISTTNSTAVATSVTYTNCFTSTYRNYLVMIDGTQSTSSGFMQLQMRASGTTQTTNYYGGRFQVGTSGSGYSVGQTNAASWEICDGSSNKFTIAANIMTPQVGKVQCNTRYWTRNGDTGGIQQGFIDTTTQYDSMVFLYSGTFTGTVSIYGYGI